MSDWREYILQHFQTPSHRLTLVADPDRLMLEERLLASIHANGFQLLRFDDPVQFRYAYESQFRHKWDRGEETELVVVLRSPEHDLDRLPYDLLCVGRRLRFQLSDLFPKLSYPVVRELDRADLDALFAAFQDYRGDELGDRGTRAYILRHVFGVSPETLRTAADVLKHLLSRHYAGRRVPPTIDSLLLERLQQLPEIRNWPLQAILADRSAFFDFVQHAWPRFLVEQHALITGAREPRIEYAEDIPFLPLDEPDVRAFVDSLFLEGYLRPIVVPDDFPSGKSWRRDDWTQVGVVRQPELDRQLRFEKLLTVARETLPDTAATHKEWGRFARTWAEVVILRHSFPATMPLPGPEYREDFGQLQLAVESRFAEWMQKRYLALYNYPPLPAPVMLHQIPHYLAHQLKAGRLKRVALIVIDGLALNQWLLIQTQLQASHSDWGFAETAVFAWVPTLTSVSRQSIFAAWPPLNFPSTWDRTDREPKHWTRFWMDEGLPEPAIGYFRGPNLDDDPDLDAWLQDTRSVVAGLVVNKVDDIMHGMQLGTQGMHQQVSLWAEQGNLPRLLSKLYQAGFTVFITADHGNIAAKGIGKPQQGALIEERGKRALQFSQPAFLAQAQAQYPDAISWRSDALPDAIHVLLADGLDSFDTLEEESVCHGGISLEEVIVPFIQVTSVPA